MSSATPTREAIEAVIRSHLPNQGSACAYHCPFATPYPNLLSYTMRRVPWATSLAGQLPPTEQ